MHRQSNHQKARLRFAAPVVVGRAGMGASRMRVLVSVLAGVVAAPWGVFDLEARGQQTDQLVTTGLGYEPRQAGIPYDRVEEKDQPRCVGKYETIQGADGLMIYSPDGQLLRRFADINGDRNVDQWSYYKDGIEIYRDVDSDFNGVADQYRWLGPQGIRWGIDKDEDGTVDSWKRISAEEITLEVVEAIKARDPQRFQKLLLTGSELDSLKLGEKTKSALMERVEKSKLGFAEYLEKQKDFGADARWIQFAADKPGLVPAGTDGSTADVLAYENVVALVENQGANQQILVGTLVQVGDTWRLADSPRSAESANVADSGFFFPTLPANREMTAAAPSGGMSEALQGLLAELDKIDTSMRDGGNANAELYAERAKVLRKLITASQGTEDMGSWIHQFADSVSSAVQTGAYPDGISQLQSLETSLDQIPGGAEHRAYVAFRTITSENMVQLMDPKANYAVIQEAHIEKLKAFSEQYATSPDAAEAMIQIGLHYELGGEETEAQDWYKRVAKNFAETDFGKKAAGAIVRLNLQGKTLNLRGKTLEGKEVQTAGPTIVHYWATWCDPCKADMAELRKMQAKYAKQNLQIVGVNLDNDPATAAQFLKENAGKYPWAHIHEQGGFQSDLATKLGVLSVPVTILIDAKGVVVKRTAGFASSVEMVQELEKLMEAVPAAKPKQANARPAPNKTTK